MISRSLYSCFLVCFRSCTLYTTFYRQLSAYIQQNFKVPIAFCTTATQTFLNGLATKFILLVKAYRVVFWFVFGRAPFAQLSPGNEVLTFSKISKCQSPFILRPHINYSARISDKISMISRSLYSSFLVCFLSCTLCTTFYRQLRAYIQQNFKVPIPFYTTATHKLFCTD